MISVVWLGMLLGWGAAVPIGPVNLEIVRRHLFFGGWHGVLFGGGACLADVMYLVLLSLGLLAVFSTPAWLALIGFLGGGLLLWFGVRALLSHAVDETTAPLSEKEAQQSPPLWRHVISGFLLTALNPYTILFWLAMSAQAMTLGHGVLPWMMTGVLTGTVSWVLGLNALLHITRHRLSHRFMLRLNRLGGLILIGFGFFGLFEAIF